MSGTAEVLAQRRDPYGRRSRRRLPPAGQVAVFVPLDALLLSPPSETQPGGAASWRAGALAAVRALQAHGYRVLVLATPASQAGMPQDLAQSLLHEAALEAELETDLEAQALPAQLQKIAAARHLDLRRAWFISSDEALGTASRRTGCRSVRLLEAGRQARRRWPLLRGHVPMRLGEAVAYVLRCDGHLAAGQSLSVQA